MSEENKSVSNKDKDIEDNKTVAALSYIWVLCLVPLLTKKRSKFAQFHAKQGLVLFIAEIVGVFVFWIPLIGWALGIALLVVSIMGILKALNGEWWKIPYVYDWSKKFNL
ncbi:DUF4870 domain-containing protein [Candidatus Parcubacteria bacterium]|nr:DUF4870 domain-containing protein [Candidatus Parcubacteria bacterium]